VQGFVCYDDAVTGAESMRHVAGEIKALLDVDDGVCAVFLCLRNGFKHKLNVVVSVGVHFLTVVFGDGLSGLTFQCPAQLVLTQCVRGCALGGGFRLTILKLLLKPGGGAAVQPAVRGGCRQNGVFGWRHQNTSASAISAA